MNTQHVELLEAWRIHLIAARASRETIRLRTYYVRRFSHDYGRPLERVTLRDLESWIAAHTWSAETARSARSSLAAFWSWAAGEELLASNPAGKLHAISEAAPHPHPCPERLYRAALEAADDRLHLMLRLAGEAGMRRGEVAQVHARDVEETLLGPELCVHGKGGKERRVPISASLEREIVAACAGGWAFPTPAGSHLTPGHVGKLVANALEPPYSMHSLRHRFATRAYGASNDLVAVQELLGHASIKTTRRYVAIADERLRLVAAAAA